MFSEAHHAALRKGRGLGFLECRKGGASAVDALIDCVINDPRWDRQVESRSDYYARLFLLTKAPVDALSEFLISKDHSECPSDTWLPVSVLTELCMRDHAPAAKEINRVVASGQTTGDCLNALDVRGLIPRIIEIESIENLIKRADRTQVLRFMDDCPQAPWKKWAEEIPTLRFILNSPSLPESKDRLFGGPMSWIYNRPSTTPPQTGPNIQQLSTRQFFAQEVKGLCLNPKTAQTLAQRDDSDSKLVLQQQLESKDERKIALALWEFGKRGETQFIQKATDILLRDIDAPIAERAIHHARLGALRYFQELPAQTTLPLARKWLFEPWPLSLVTGRVFEKYAEEIDRPALETAGNEALHSGAMYPLCSAIDALDQIGIAPSMQLAARIFEEAPYSYARRRVVRALVNCESSPEVDSMLHESLWDCEVESREISCEQAPFLKHLPVPFSRLREIADDPFEDKSVRESANFHRG